MSDVRRRFIRKLRTKNHNSDDGPSNFNSLEAFRFRLALKATLVFEFLSGFLPDVSGHTLRKIRIMQWLSSRKNIFFDHKVISEVKLLIFETTYAKFTDQHLLARNLRTLAHNKPFKLQKFNFFLYSHWRHRIRLN